MQPRRRCRAAGLPDLAAWVSWARLALLAFLALGAWLASDAHGAEAVRYRDGQGTEIIGGRATAIPATVAPPVMPVTRTSPIFLQRTHQPQQAAPPRLHITAHEQQARDRDRLAILRQELDAELAAVHANIAQSRILEPEPLQRSREQLRRHQENIRALQGEIARAARAAK